MRVAQSGLIRASAVVDAIAFAGILAAMTLGPRTAVGQTPGMRGGCPEEPARFYPMCAGEGTDLQSPAYPRWQT